MSGTFISISLVQPPGSKKMWSVGDIGSRCFYLNLFGFVIYAMVEQNDATLELAKWQQWVVDVWTWMYMGSRNVWICVLIYVLYKFGGLKLGKEDDQPEFSDMRWFAMIFSCGVATGFGSTLQKECGITKVMAHLVGWICRCST